MEMHVLPGDSLVETFEATKIGGEVIVFRECLIDGDVFAETLEDFWEIRASYLDDAFPDPDKSYNSHAKPEFEKILNAAESATINLWFEYELFCQVNLWFCLFLLRDSGADIYRVEPAVRKADDLWLGFGGLSEHELENCFSQRKKLSPGDVMLGSQLWLAFQTGNFEQLRILSGTETESFPYLGDVCAAAAELETRPKHALKKIISEGETEFGKVFRKFNETEGVYGFGDAQVKRLFDEIRKEREL